MRLDRLLRRITLGQPLGELLGGGVNRLRRVEGVDAQARRRAIQILHHPLRRTPLRRRSFRQRIETGLLRPRAISRFSGTLCLREAASNQGR